MKSFFQDKRILVTGACGTVGSELMRQLVADYNCEEVIALDNNETALFLLEQSFSNHPNTSFYLADIRDIDKLSRKMRFIDVVFHTAAFKHVVLCERSPFEAVQTNIVGVQNVVTAARENKVAKVIFTSSDKAVNPTSVMGTSKLMGERLMTAATSNHQRDDTVFASTRFGNVLGSRGSVFAVFHEQIRRGGPLTLTDPEMTRFIMSIQAAVQLVIESAYIACGGEVFVTKMPAIRIRDLADVMIQAIAPEYGIPPEGIRIRTIGLKPGEKMYEELMSLEEIRRAWELNRYFVILPPFTQLYQNVTRDYPEFVARQVTNPYHSGNEPPLSRAALEGFLRQHDLLSGCTEPSYSAI